MHKHRGINKTRKSGLINVRPIFKYPKESDEKLGELTILQIMQI